MTIDKAKADDPKELKRRIAALEKQLAERQAVQPERITSISCAVSTGTSTRAFISQLDAVGTRLESAVDETSEIAREIVAKIDKATQLPPFRETPARRESVVPIKVNVMNHFIARQRATAFFRSNENMLCYVALGKEACR